MQVILAILIVAGGGAALLSTLGRAREHGGLPARILAPVSGRRTGTLLSLLAHPSSREARGKALADAHLVWEKARAQNWLEQHKHTRAMEAKDGPRARSGAPAAARPGDAFMAAPERRGWRRLVPSGQVTVVRPGSPPEPAGGTAEPGAITPAPPEPAAAAIPAWLARPRQRPETSSRPPDPPGPPRTSQQPTIHPDAGGNPVSLTDTPVSTPSAGPVEQVLEGIRALSHSGATGGFDGKNAAVASLAAIHEELSRAEMHIAQAMSEDGHYSASLWEPLQQAGGADRAQAANLDEIKARLLGLARASLGELKASGTRVPHYREFEEGPAR